MADVLKEFLVKLGFNVDQGGLGRFVGGVTKATEVTTALGVAAVTTTTAIVKSVEIIAQQWERLYYIGQRTGVTAQGLLSVGYAASQIGVGADEALGSLETLSSLMRTNPGIDAFVRGMGHISRAETDAAKIQEQFIQGIARFPYYVQVQFAQLAGISERQLFQYRKMADERRRREEEARRLYRDAGVDLVDFDRKSVEFMRHLRDLGLNWDVLTATISARWMPVADRLIDWMIKALAYFRQLDNYTGGWASTLLGGAGLVIGFTTLYNILAKLTGILPILTTRMFGLGTAIGAALYAGYEIYQHWDQIKEYLTKTWNEIRAAFGHGLWPGIKEIQRQLDDLAKQLTGVDMTPWMQAGSRFMDAFVKGLIDEAKSVLPKWFLDLPGQLHGLWGGGAGTPPAMEQGPGMWSRLRDWWNNLPSFGGFGGDGTPGQEGEWQKRGPFLPGVRAAQLVKKYESGGNYNIGYGGVDLSNAPRDQYGFPIWSGVRGSHAAGAYEFQPETWAKYAGPLGIHDFSPQSQDKVFAAAYAAEGFAPWAPYNERLRTALGSGGDVAVNTHTTINVTGYNAQDIARHVIDAQSRVNADALRNLKTAVQ